VMDIEEIREILKGKPSIDTEPEIYKRLVEIGVRTGSTVFGGSSLDDVDIDLIIPPDDILNWEKLLSLGFYASETYRGEDYSSMYVNGKKGRIVNLLFMESLAVYNRWVYATEMLKEMWKNEKFFPVLIEKGRRVELFEMFQRFKEEGL